MQAILSKTNGAVLRCEAEDPSLDGTLDRDAEVAMAMLDDEQEPEDLGNYTAREGRFVLRESLAPTVEERCDAIDLRTDELIALGFEYPSGSGNRFSLTLEAQMRIQGCMSSRLLPQFTFPINWNTIDNDGTYAVTSADEMVAFYLTAAGTLRYRIDTGTALKTAIRNAATFDEREAIVDTR